MTAVAKVWTVPQQNTCQHCESEIPTTNELCTKCTISELLLELEQERWLLVQFQNCGEAYSMGNNSVKPSILGIKRKLLKLGYTAENEKEKQKLQELAEQKELVEHSIAEKTKQFDRQKKREGWYLIEHDLQFLYIERSKIAEQIKLAHY